MDARRLPAPLDVPRGPARTRIRRRSCAKLPKPPHPRKLKRARQGGQKDGEGRQDAGYRKQQRRGTSPPSAPRPRRSPPPPAAGARSGRSRSPGPASAIPTRCSIPEQGDHQGGARPLLRAGRRLDPLPHLVDRPLTLVRCPEGRGGQCCSIRSTSASTSRRRSTGWTSASPSPTAPSIPSTACSPWRRWGYWRSIHLGRPPRPHRAARLTSVPRLRSRRGARLVAGGRGGAGDVRAFLGELGLQSFLKTTGGKGLHVVLPIARKEGWDEVKAFTKGDRRETMAANEPAKYTSKLPKASRKGKIFIDYLRNGRGATSICAYSTRARANAPVSVPSSGKSWRPTSAATPTLSAPSPSGWKSSSSGPWGRDFSQGAAVDHSGDEEGGGGGGRGCARA